MPRKHYVVTGTAFNLNEDEDELNISFQNPREIQQVVITHAAFTLDLAGEAPGQLTLRSDALTEGTSSRVRELNRELEYKNDWSSI